MLKYNFWQPFAERLLQQSVSLAVAESHTKNVPTFVRQTHLVIHSHFHVNQYKCTLLKNFSHYHYHCQLLTNVRNSFMSHCEQCTLYTAHKCTLPAQSVISGRTYGRQPTTLYLLYILYQKIRLTNNNQQQVMTLISSAQQQSIQCF